MPPFPPRRLLSLSFLTITFQPSAEVHELSWEPAPPSDLPALSWSGVDPCRLRWQAQEIQKEERARLWTSPPLRRPALCRGPQSCAGPFPCLLRDGSELRSPPWVPTDGQESSPEKSTRRCQIRALDEPGIPDLSRKRPQGLLPGPESPQNTILVQISIYIKQQQQQTTTILM